MEKFANVPLFNDSLNFEISQFQTGSKKMRILPLFTVGLHASISTKLSSMLKEIFKLW